MKLFKNQLQRINLIFLEYIEIRIWKLIYSRQKRFKDIKWGKNIETGRVLYPFAWGWSVRTTSYSPPPPVCPDNLFSPT